MMTLHRVFLVSRNFFEARKPKGLAIIAEFGGIATIKDTKKKREVIVTNNETGETKAYLIPMVHVLRLQIIRFLKPVMN